MPFIAFALWPFISLSFFRALPLGKAIVWSLVLGYLFLPENFEVDFPGIPPINKTSLSLFLLPFGVYIFASTRPTRDATRNANRLSGVILFSLVALMLLRPVLTVFNNRDPIYFTQNSLSALGLWDIVNMTWSNLLVLVPFLVAWRYLATPKDHRVILHVLVLTGLIYSLLMLVELRLSPQLHRWVYGFHQHSFAQHFRGGGYRPKVFLDHGLGVGFFIYSTVVAALWMWRSPAVQNRRFYGFAGLWLLGILALSSNLGAMVLALLALAVFCLPKRMQIWFAFIVAMAFLLYPVVRQSGIFPLERVVSLATAVNEERASSLVFRLNNEDQLLARAAEKPLFGWGGWGRARVYDAQGRDLSVTDGIWVIVLGSTGWLGYLSFFGLLAGPVLLLGRVRRRKDIPPETIALAIIMAGNFIYMVPNSTLSPVGWMIAGALAGFVQFDRSQKQAETAEETDPSPQSRLQYSRFPPRAPATPDETPVKRSLRTSG